MRALQHAFDNASRALSGISMQIGGVVQRVAASPPSRGYEPWLVEHGRNPIPSRMMAVLLVQHGTRTAKEAARLSEIVDAVRFLANPRRNRPAFSRRVKILLAAWEETSIIETIFANAGLNESEFIRLLKSISEGQGAVRYRLAEIAASVAPYLPSRRGPKVSAASAAHELFLERVVKRMEPRAYTWSDLHGKCTDPVTEATRREFECRDFDSRSAYRRLKARQTEDCVDGYGKRT